MGAVGRRAPAVIRNNASSRKETLVHGKDWHWERSSSAAQQSPHPIGSFLTLILTQPRMGTTTKRETKRRERNGASPSPRQHEHKAEPRTEL